MSDSIQKSSSLVLIEHVFRYYSSSSWKNSIPMEYGLGSKTLKDNYDPIPFEKLQRAKKILEEKCKVYEICSEDGEKISSYNLEGNIKVIYIEPIDSKDKPFSLEIIADSDSDVKDFANSLSLRII